MESTTPETPTTPSDAQNQPLLTDDTLAALDIARQPFEPQPADGGRFEDDITIEQIDEIRAALVSGDPLLLLSGPDGAGKSTLLQQLSANSGQRLQFFSVRGGSNFSTNNLFVGMLEAFKVEPKGELKDVLDDLTVCLQAMLERGTTSVIMLDDADAVPANELTTLLSSMLYVNRSEDTLLRIAFAARPEFEPHIPDLLPEGADLPYSSLVIEPLSAERVRGYMAFRMSQAGYFDELPLDERQIASIASEAGGYPGPINALTSDTLNAMYSSDGAARGGAGWFSGGNGRLMKLAFGALALGLILAGLLYRGPSNQNGNTPDTVAQNADNNDFVVVEQQQVTPKPIGDDTDAATDTDTATSSNEDVSSSDATGDAASNATSASANAADNPPFSPSGTDSSASESDATSAETSAATQPSGAGAGATDAATSGTQATAAKPSAPVTSNTATAESGAADAENTSDSGSATPAQPDTDSGSDVASSPAPSDSESGSGSNPESEAGPEPASPSSDSAAASDATAAPETGDSAAADASAASETAAESPQTPAVSGVNQLESANWVLVQNPEQYTIQMSASTDLPSVELFLRRAGLDGPNSIFSFKRNGATWYALVHGLYPTITAARAEIERMSSAARSNQPWIRGIGKIQQALKSE